MIPAHTFIDNVASSTSDQDFDEINRGENEN